MASDAERKAGFDVAQAKVIGIVKQFAPAFAEARIEQKIIANPGMTQEIVDAVLDAAEKERDAK